MILSTGVYQEAEVTCKHNPSRGKLTFTGVLIFVLKCGLFPNPDTTPTNKATPTNSPETGNAPFQPETTNRHEGISGALEMQVLAGPAAAASMEPHAVGNFPISIVNAGKIHNIQGGGGLSYQQVLEESWETYIVSFDMTTNISG